MKTPAAPLLACVALLAASSDATAQDSRPAKGRTVVVIVGIEDYQDPKIPDLTLAEDDAQAIHDFFARNRRSRTTADRVHLLLGKKATRAGVLGAIRQHLVGRYPRKARHGDPLLRGPGDLYGEREIPRRR